MVKQKMQREIKQKENKQRRVKQKENKQRVNISDKYLMNSLIFLKILIYRLFIVMGVILTLFKVFSFIYDDVNFIELPNNLLFVASFVVINYFFLMFVKKMYTDSQGNNEFLTEVQFDLYEESMLGLSLFTLYWFILTNFHVLL